MYDVFGSFSKLNHMAYNNPKVDELLKAQFEEGDLKQRVKLVHQIEDIVMEEAPYAFTLHPKDYVAMHKEVKGFRFVPGLREMAEVYL